MSGIMKRIRAGHPVRDVLPIVAKMEEDDFQKCFGAVTDEEVTQLGVWSSHALNVVGMESTLWIGGVLAMYRTATAQKSRDELWELMLLELDISETQAYRAIAVWQRSGRMLLAEPSLVSMFVVEALKLLCSKRVPKAALLAATDLARQGKRIDIATAKRLIETHRPAEAAAKPSTASRVTEAAQSVSKKLSKVTDSFNRCRVFTGRMVRIVLEPAGSPTGCDAQAVIDDLKALISELQDELSQSSPTPASEAAHV